jgi:hypothetical protein
VKACTVGEAIDAASRLAADRGRLIVEVVVDGEQWTDAELSEPGRLGSAADVLQLATAEPRTLVAAAFADAEEGLRDIAQLQREAAELLQEDRQTVAMDRLGDAVSIWASIHETVTKGAEIAGLDLQSQHVGAAPLRDAVARLGGRLHAVRDALSHDDQISLADTLLYEFPEVVTEWRAILAELRQRLEQPCAPAPSCDD